MLSFQKRLNYELLFDKKKECCRIKHSKYLFQNTSLAASGALAHYLQRRTPCKRQNGRLVFGHSHQLSLNKFFDLSIPSMRKGYDGGETGGENRETIIRK